SSSKENVLNDLHKAVTRLRSKLGESLASVQQFDKPLSEATTSSLEALKAFTLGDLKHSGGAELDAAPHYLRAVELDPNFTLANTYNRLGQFANAVENGQQAVNADPASVSGYSNLAQAYAGMNRLEEAKATLQAAIQHGLNNSGMHMQMAALYWAQGDDASME